MTDEETQYKKGLNILQNSEFRVTKQRKDLLKYLSKFESQYVSVTDVDNFMQQLYPNVSHTTTYRNIKEFSELGIVEQRSENGQLNVKFQCDFVSPQHGHFFCQNCHRVIKIDSSLSPALKESLKEFLVLNIKLELFGLCDRCQQNNKTA
ncbi:Fur family transcriptional regulator [Leuconostoc suionicum]|uniref:Fur family transcriptional regulator n=1 Tax=Leuconostoc suionicum TaxID=1511761 RepID=UPI0021AAE161|nr:transcriptional repressor [Leuconostoc suionicum]MCT4381812.1 transcriptional repressor [Leuconostoc suionicum]MDC2805387.1 transcriptional repressor [Leuconostoc suionicum]MDC2815614.1 transcriptional repressor [Leuconostoc suionicum]MDC2822899.1 transcriptional repressor [Leuconostoc suionicum]